jgi:hypothetical protein
MKKKIFQWIVPLGVIWLSCCQKELKWHLCGTVVEYGTGKPIPKATVNLGLHDPDTGSGGSSVYTKQVHADADGRFCHDGRVDVVGAEAEGYYPSGNQDIFIGENNREDWEVPLCPYAWVKITMRNKSGLFYGISPPFSNQTYKIPNNAEQTILIETRGNLNKKAIYALLATSTSVVYDDKLVSFFLNDLLVETSPSPNQEYTGGVDVYVAGHDTMFINLVF